MFYFDLKSVKLNKLDIFTRKKRVFIGWKVRRKKTNFSFHKLNIPLCDLLELSEIDFAVPALIEISREVSNE